jgi:predicted AlkP superfamily phosphohydrolase/phosphomutase
MPHASCSVILLEFNELSPVLMDHFIHEGMLPNFRKLREESQCYVTDADGRPPHLEPWIQWTTVHSGMNYQEHGITRLNEGHNLTRKCVWDLLSDAGFRVWVCGAMNVNYESKLNGAVLPDPWASEVEPRPVELKTFYRFIKKNVPEHTNEDAHFDRKDYLAFVAFLSRHGLSISTVRAVTRQLLGERWGAGRWRRAVLLDRLQFDVFRNYYRRLRPDFSVFFSNSTAYFQHMYWRNMDPEPFRLKPTAQEQTEFGDAVVFGYQQMDWLVGKFLTLASEYTTLVFTTALSQQPCLVYEDQGGKCFYRPRDFASFLAFAGIRQYGEVAPDMSEQFYVRFTDEAGAQMGERSLKALEMGGRPLLSVDRLDNEVFCGCQVYKPVPDGATLLVRGSDRTVPFYELFYRAEGLKSGMHHPDGMLWIRFPSRDHRVHDNKAPLISVAPTLLDLFSVTAPAYMRGKSLLRPAALSSNRNAFSARA